MKITTLFLLIAALIVGCSNKKTINIDGNTYTLIQAGKTNVNGINDVELWERKGVTNKYYTPSIDGKSMHSIMK
jgi:hypothetical protein